MKTRVSAVTTIAREISEVLTGLAVAEMKVGDTVEIVGNSSPMVDLRSFVGHIGELTQLNFLGLSHVRLMASEDEILVGNPRDMRPIYSVAAPIDLGDALTIAP